MTDLHFKFSGLSLGYRLCIQSSTSKSRQNQFVTKITGESVLNNLTDLQMFSKQVVHGRGKSQGGGTCQNFDRDARPIFVGLKFGQILFFWVGKFFSYFSGFCKISAIFLGLTNFQLFFGVFQFLCHRLKSFA